ncbi:MAG: DUF1080 domain-containing protein [Opitutaceae bacterium]
MKLTHSLSAFGLALALLSPLSGKSLLPADPIVLDSLQTFKSPSENWVLASDIGGDPRRSKELTAVPGTGVLVNVAPNKSGDHLTSAWEHGDIELSFEFLMPQESNSGIYLMGRYELQLLESWGVEEPGVHDCGAIYERWITEKKEGYEGTAPLVNATRAPGLWQTMRILFQAPRFDKKGKKTANARFLEVEHNGFLIHQDVEVTGPTRGAEWPKEAATGPIQIQGNHGPIAFRNITKRPFDLTTEVTLQDVQSKVTRRKNAAVTKDDEEAPTEDLPSAAASNIDPGALGESTHFTVIYTGKINIPNSGTYAFDAVSRGTINLSVNGQPVLIPINPGVRFVPIELKAGLHPFKLEYTHGRWNKPQLDLFVEGPRVARQILDTASAKMEAREMAQALTAAMADEEKPVAKSQKEKRTEIIVAPPTDGIRLQRGFTPFDPRKRLYSISVGSSTGVHYAYDFDTATILRTWNGPFLDLFEFWDGRAHNQLTKHIGPALTFHDKPTIALLESGQHDWPVETDAMWSAEGYTLDAKGNPTFLSRLTDIEISDRIVAATSPRRLDRHLTLQGDHTSWMTGILLAEAPTITLEANGNSYIIGDRSYYLDVPASNKAKPFIRRINGRDQLVLFPSKSGKDVKLSYTLVW